LSHFRGQHDADELSCGIGRIGWPLLSQ
jgi:hypothetical protein